MRPLDRLPSIKLKLGVTIVAAVAVSALVSTAGLRLGVPIALRPVIAALLALAMVQFLARGMTSPLREMVSAATAMARGDYERRVTATSRDEVGDLARAFNAMAAQLGEIDRIRRDLVANASHELRTPLSALQALLENVVDGIADADAETMRNLLRQVERLTRLVEQLLDLSRLESGVVELHRQRFDAARLVHEAVEECRLRSGDRDVQIVARASDRLIVNADAERVRQVVTNLIENAVRYSPPSGTVEVTARVHRGVLILEVVDEGPGIADDEADRVFERFYRADAARATDAGGAGLGLAIARWIAELHGGTIRVDRHSPHGCRMVVTLPEEAAA